MRTPTISPLIATSGISTCNYMHMYVILYTNNATRYHSIIRLFVSYYHILHDQHCGGHLNVEGSGALMTRRLNDDAQAVVDAHGERADQPRHGLFGHDRGQVNPSVGSETQQAIYIYIHVWYAT